MIEYATKESAQKAADARNKADPTWFCPLINERCRSDCYSFGIAYVRSQLKSGSGLPGAVHNSMAYFVYGPACYNTIVNGGDP